MGAMDQGANHTSGRWSTLPRTLTFVFWGNRVLLLKRSATRRVFPGRFNGLGGHVERHEDILTSAVREVQEESGLVVDRIWLHAIHNIDSGEKGGILLFVFVAECDDPDPLITSNEGTLHWVPIDQLEELDLVEDLPHQLASIAAARNARLLQFAHVSYDAHDRIQIRVNVEFP
jgi:8-oxo-dGTP diphosphatase